MHSHPPPPPPAPPKGTRFGPYTLEERVGLGGMAEVFRASEPRPVGEPRTVVLKRMLPHIASEAGAAEMFREEARLGGLVRHDNVVHVLGEGDTDGQPYLVLEYVRGCDLWRLGRWLTREGRTLEPALGMFVVYELLCGLQAVHEAADGDGRPLGIVHRDVSPSNVLVSVHGDVKLGDFGIARARLRERFPQAPSGERAKGKLGYLAPEQVSGYAPDGRGDVFSAGVIAAELLMGRPLFTGGSELAILLAVRDAQVGPFLEITGSLPRGLGEAVEAALQRDPDARPASAREFAAMLRPFTESGDAAAPMRKEIGGLITRAMSAITPSTRPGGAPSKTPSAGVQMLAALADERTPLRAAGEAPDEAPATRDVPTLDYQVRTTDGRLLGPWTFAQVVEALATGTLGPLDKVSRSGGAFRAVNDIVDLSRHLPVSSLTPITRDAPEPQEPDEATPLADGGFIRALARLVIREDTGLLLCERGSSRKEVYVQNGVPEFVQSNLAGELLGEYLVARGVISRGELDMALAVMPRFEGRLGDTLVALGLVEAVHLFQHIAAQVQEKLLDLFLWTTGTARFFRGVPPPPSGFPLGLDAWRIVDEGTRRRLAQGLEDDRFRTRMMDSLERAARIPTEVATGELPPDAKQLLRAVETPMALHEAVDLLGDATGVDPNRPYRAIILLLQLDAVRWQNPNASVPAP